MELYYFGHPYTLKGFNNEIIPNSGQVMYDLCRYRTGKLLGMGYRVFSPITHSHGLGEFDWQFWMDFDKDLINHINFKGIILAPAWEDSKGCLFEKLLFETMNKPVLYYVDIIKQGKVKNSCAEVWKNFEVGKYD